MKNQRINYLEQIVSFWKLNITQDFNATEIATYLYLLEVNNSCGWRKSFSHNNKKIQATIGVSFKTMKAAILKLKEAGLIEYETQNGIPNITYQITTLSKFPKVWDKVLDEGSGEVLDEINKTKDKQNNIKRNLDDDFSFYVEIIKSDKEKIWRDSIYEKFNLSPGSLQKLLDEFKLSEISAGKTKLDDNIDSFKRHFRNWLNLIDKVGILDEYRSLKHRKTPSI